MDWDICSVVRRKSMKRVKAVLGDENSTTFMAGLLTLVMLATLAGCSEGENMSADKEEAPGGDNALIGKWEVQGTLQLPTHKERIHAWK